MIMLAFVSNWRCIFRPFPLLLAIPILASLSACIAIPLRPGDEEPIKDEQLAFIEIGKTTKEEISTAMSDFAIKHDGGELTVKLTPQRFRDGDWWLYAQTRKETKWFVIYGLPCGGCADAGTVGDVDYRLLLIKFDNNGIVAEYALSSSEGNGCDRYGICVRESHYMLLASDDEDRVVKQFDIPADGCGVYVYGKKRVVAPIWLDNHRVGWHLDKKQFFFWQLDPGIHQLGSRNLDVADQSPIEFNCAAGGLYFFELKKKIISWAPLSVRVEIEQRDAVKGRKAIGKRQLTLNTTEPSD